MKNNNAYIKRDSMPKEYEYHEGKKAQENFEEGMKALFQAPKDAVKGKKKPAGSGLKTLKVRPANPMFSRDSGEA